MASPLKVNIATMVNSSATSVIGAMRGMNCLLVPILAFQRHRITRLNMPAANGMPR